MIKAIIYTSNSGYTREYAELLSKSAGIPAYDLKKGFPKELSGQRVVYMGWLMAGKLMGFKKAAKLCDIAAVCQVGMAPASDERQNEEAVKKYCLNVPVFYLQGGFDINRLKGIYKFMMNTMSKSVKKKLDEKKELTPDDKIMKKMVETGCSCVDPERLLGIKELIAGENSL